MAAQAPGSILNYTLGGIQFYFDEGADTSGGAVADYATSGAYLGNVTVGSFTVDITELDHFSSKSGNRLKDRTVAQETDISMTLTLDEPCLENMATFMLGKADYTDAAGAAVTAIGTDPGGATPTAFAPFIVNNRAGAATYAGVSDTGNEFRWDIPSVAITPDGEFAYADTDWTTFSLGVAVLADPNIPALPYGVVTHYGVTVADGATAGLPEVLPATDPS